MYLFPRAGLSNPYLTQTHTQMNKVFAFPNKITNNIKLYFSTEQAQVSLGSQELHQEEAFY